ncbi:MAG: leucine-rich repeat domain-containing protein [Muribaculaceae bacterium]|nr:leucine-rich repeat domain-containing protein [Muribaculaceae bacterium]
MKKFLLAIATACIGMSYAAAQDIVEIDGLYYRLAPETGTATLARPDSGMYTGEVTLNPEVVWENTKYNVNGRTAYVALNPSEITHFTLGEGWAENSVSGLSFVQDSKLEQVTVKSFNMMNYINVGNNPVVQVNLRKISETETQLILENWNVYGPDGKKLVPYLYEEYSGAEPVYADSDGVFHLGENWNTKTGQYCGILPMGMSTYNASYWIVLLQADYNGQKITIRCQPPANYTGQFVEDNSLKYMFNYDHFAVFGIAEGAEWPEEVTMPESLEYEGKSYPVTALCYNAFLNSTSRKVTLPSGITDFGNYAFENCQNLVEADLSAIKAYYPDLTTLFYNCASLETVSLPSHSLYFNKTFVNCPELKDVIFPNESGLNYMCSNCPKLIDFEILENSDETVRGRIISTIKWGSRLKPIYYLESSATLNIINADDEGIFTFPRTELYNSSGRFGGILKIYAKDDDEMFDGIVCQISIPEETSGVETVNPSDSANMPVEYFTISGMRVNGEPSAAGVYILRQGSKTEKVLIK